MRKLLLIGGFVFVSTISCATGVILNNQLSPHAIAQDFSPAQGASGKMQYQECFAVSLWSISGRNLNEGQMPKKTVKIPTGWTPMGGGYDAGAGEGNMILCR